MWLIDKTHPKILNMSIISYLLFHRLATENGYWFMREYYPLGMTPTYINSTGHRIYYYKGRLLMWADVEKDLVENWCPVSRSDVLWYEQNIRS